MHINIEKITNYKKLSLLSAEWLFLTFALIFTINLFLNLQLFILIFSLATITFIALLIDTILMIIIFIHKRKTTVKET